MREDAILMFRIYGTSFENRPLVNVSINIYTLSCAPNWTDSRSLTAIQPTKMKNISFSMQTLTTPHRTLNLCVWSVSTNFEWNGSVVRLCAEQPTDWRAYVRAPRHTGRIPNVFLFHFLFSSVRASWAEWNEIKILSDKLLDRVECVRKTDANPSVPHTDGRVVWVNESGIS